MIDSVLEKANEIISNLEKQHLNFTIAIFYLQKYPDKDINEILENLENHGYPCLLGSEYIKKAFEIIDQIESK